MGIAECILHTGGASTTAAHADAGRAKVGSTAFAIAALRAVESRRLHPLFKCTASESLFSLHGGAPLATRMLVLLFPLRRQLACLMPATIAADMVALRTWHLDREIAAALERSAGLPPQLVIVGAGLDFRCVRLAGSLGGGKVFELDFQGMLDEKWALLGAAGVPPPPHLVSVGCDLSLGPAGWVDELRRRGFDDRRPSVWLLEGLVPYLKPPELEALLRAISELSAPQSSLLATFISPTRPAGSVGASVSVSMNKYTTESPADTLSTFGPAAVVTIGELITRCGARGETMGIQPSDASYTFATACRE